MELLRTFTKIAEWLYIKVQKFFSIVAKAKRCCPLINVAPCVLKNAAALLFLMTGWNASAF
jgi:hypothetical protein